MRWDGQVKGCKKMGNKSGNTQTQWTQKKGKVTAEVEGMCEVGRRQTGSTSWRGAAGDRAL